MCTARPLNPTAARADSAMPPISPDDTPRIDSHAHPRELPADALALMDRAEQRHIEFGADWFALLVDAVYARDRQAQQVRFQVLRRGPRVLAVLPLVAHADAPGGEVGALSNFY